MSCVCGVRAMWWAMAKFHISNAYTAPCDHALGGIDNTALHQIIITPRIILQTRFHAFAVASSGESVDICDALEIVLFLSLPFCSARFTIFSTSSTISHVPLLMLFLSFTCFLIPLHFPAHYISFFKFLHVNFSFFLFLHSFPPCSCIISFFSLMRL